MLCLEINASTQYTHGALQVGAQPAPWVLVHVGWSQGLGGPGHAAHLQREIVYGQQ